MHMKWAKYILGVNNKSTNIALTAELGRYPLIIDIICTAVNIGQEWVKPERTPFFKIAIGLMFRVTQMVRTVGYHLLKILQIDPTSIQK